MAAATGRRYLRPPSAYEERKLNLTRPSPPTGVWVATRQYGPDERGRHDVTHRRPPPPPAIGVDLLTLLQKPPTLDNSVILFIVGRTEWALGGPSTSSNVSYGTHRCSCVPNYFSSVQLSSTAKKEETQTGRQMALAPRSNSWTTRRGASLAEALGCNFPQSLAEMCVLCGIEPRPAPGTVPVSLSLHFPRARVQQQQCNVSYLRCAVLTSQATTRIRRVATNGSSARLGISLRADTAIPRIAVRS
jgi:hypothetical protein